MTRKTIGVMSITCLAIGCAWFVLPPLRNVLAGCNASDGKVYDVRIRHAPSQCTIPDHKRSFVGYTYTVSYIAEVYIKSGSSWIPVPTPTGTFAWRVQRNGTGAIDGVDGATTQEVAAKGTAISSSRGDTVLQVTYTPQNLVGLPCVFKWPVTIVDLDFLEQNAKYNFSPSLSEEATVRIRTVPAPPLGTTWTDIEASSRIIRKLMNGIQEIDKLIMISTPSPCLSRQIDFQILNILWNGIPGVTRGTAAPAGYGPETFSGLSTAGSVNRYLSKVDLDKCVPPPIYYDRTTLLEGEIVLEKDHVIFVPAVVQLIWAQDALNLLTQGVVSPGPPITTIVNPIPVANIAAFEIMVRDDVQAHFDSANANIRITMIQPVEPFMIATITTVDSFVTAFGQASVVDWLNKTHHHDTDSATIHVNNAQTKCLISWGAGGSFMFPIPVTSSEFGYSLTKTTTHEVGHLLGLTKGNQYLQGLPYGYGSPPYPFDGLQDDHNPPYAVPYWRRNIMDGGGDDWKSTLVPVPEMYTMNDRLGRNGPWTWRSVNKDYLKFILPK